MNLVALLARARELFGRRAVSISLIISALAGMALTQVPLFEVPGYELSSAMAILVALVGAIAGVASARLSRRRALGGHPDPTPALAVLFAFLPAALLCLAALLFPFLTAILVALFSTRCSPWTGALFYLVLPVPSALVSCAAGVLLGFRFQRALLAGFAFATACLVTLVFTLWPVWDGPQVFALNHLFGYFPGPLYDEALPVDARLLAYRALTLVWTGLLLLACAGSLHHLTGRSSRRFSLSARGALALAALFCTAIAFRIWDFELGLQTLSPDLERALGGRSQTAHFVLHFSRAKSVADVRRLERDLEFKYDRVVAFFGDAPPGRIHAYFHPSAEEKRRLVGASETSFAKPWRLEFHVQDEPFPHPITRHELAHDVAAAFGAWPFRVSARELVNVNMGLVEGLAVAADERADELTLHQWAAAMRRLKLAPDIRGIVSPVGFWRQSAARAYTLSGSFLRFLDERYGSEKLRRAVREGDFEAAYARPLTALAAEWEAFLDGMSLDARALHAAQVRFERGSLFDRPCAREMAELRGEADLLQRADPERALSLYRRCARIEPENPAHLRAQAELFAAQDDPEAARAAWQKVLDLPGASEGARAQALMGLGDAAWEAGDPDSAREAFEKALILHRDRATDRTAAVKLEGLSDPVAAPVLRRYFQRGAELPEVLAVQELSQRQPERRGPGGEADRGSTESGRATLLYLVGRQLFSHGDGAGAARYLDEALALGLSDEEVRREALRLLVKARYLAGDGAGTRLVSERLAAQGDESDRAFAEDWRQRCAFEERTFGGLLPPPR